MRGMIKTAYSVLTRVRVAWSLALGVIAFGSGCSAPLLPSAHVPRSERAAVSEAQLLAELRRDWQLLKSKKLSKEAREQVVATYNRNVYRLMRRYRADIKKAIADNNPAYRPTGVVFRQEGVARNVPLTDIYEDIVPACEVQVEELQERYSQSGLGVPMVGVIPAARVQKAGRRFTVAGRGTVQSLTVLVEFDADPRKPAVVQLIPRNRHETYKVGGVSYPLALDISATIEVYWNLTRVKEDRFLGMLRPQQLRDTTGLTCMEAYDPNKIPVVLAHGLLSSAGTFDNMVNRLLADPVIRKHYQFWYYNYPTGVAWTISARHYRDSLTRVRRHLDPQHRNRHWDRMVVVGHSMGGLITHYSQCVEPWKMLQGRNIGGIDMSRYMDARYVDEPLPFSRRMTGLQRDYYFRPVQAARVIYLATPHRGAPMAEYSITGWLMGLVELPQTLVQEVLNVATLQQNSVLMDPGRMTEWFTSGDQLSPESYSIKGLYGLQVRNVPTHSVIGDRGRNNSPRSSDGVVPYWSSHIPWGTETVVPADHSVQDAPQTAEDLARVLKEHLRRCGRKSRG